MFDQVTLFGRRITRVQPGGLREVVNALSESDAGSAFYCNVHMLMLALEDPELARAMDRASYVFADGAPVAWLQKRIGGKAGRVVRGYEVMQALCQAAAESQSRVGLLGSTPEVLTALVKRLRSEHPDLEIAYRHSPPFVHGDLYSDASQIQTINDAHLDWLFVSLGCPKQEKWAARYAGSLNCRVHAVGAAFDWLAGTTGKPPAWMEKRGLAWLHRLLQNPSKMWRRYMIYNFKFVIKSAGLLLFGQRRAGRGRKEAE